MVKLGNGWQNEATVSRWCSNKMQPSLDMLVKIAGLLNTDVRRLLNPTEDMPV
jgi:transcriptional regulator with XRE-family HTH domain